MVGSPSLFLSLSSKPPGLSAQLQDQGGPGSLFLASPLEGSKAELRRVGLWRATQPPFLKEGAGSTGHFALPTRVQVSICMGDLYLCAPV